MIGKIVGVIFLIIGLIAMAIGAGLAEEGYFDNLLIPGALLCLIAVLYMLFHWMGKSGVAKREKEEDLYEIALEEYESKNRDKGLYAVLFTKKGGNENKTKAAYIKERVKQFQDEDEIERQNSPPSGVRLPLIVGAILILILIYVAFFVDSW